MYIKRFFSQKDANEILSGHKNKEPNLYENGMKVWFGETDGIRWVLCIPDVPIKNRDAALYAANGESLQRDVNSHYWYFGIYNIDWETTYASRIYTHLWGSKYMFTNLMETINLNMMEDFEQPLHQLRHLGMLHDDLLADAYEGKYLVDSQTMDLSDADFNSSLMSVTKKDKQALAFHHFSKKKHGFNESVFRYYDDEIEAVRIVFTPHTIEAFVNDGVKLIKVRKRLSWMNRIRNIFGLPQDMNFDGTLFESVRNPVDFQRMWDYWSLTLCL